MSVKLILKLYITGNTLKSQKAISELNNILEENFSGLYELRVIDVLKQPALAEQDKILATPTVARILPAPLRKIIGNLSDKEKVLLGLDLTIEN